MFFSAYVHFFPKGKALWLSVVAADVCAEAIVQFMAFPLQLSPAFDTQSCVSMLLKAGICTNLCVADELLCNSAMSVVKGSCRSKWFKTHFRAVEGGKKRNCIFVIGTGYWRMLLVRIWWVFNSRHRGCEWGYDGNTLIQ